MCAAFLRISLRTHVCGLRYLTADVQQQCFSLLLILCVVACMCLTLICGNQGLIHDSDMFFLREGKNRMTGKFKCMLTKLLRNLEKIAVADCMLDVVSRIHVSIV